MGVCRIQIIGHTAYRCARCPVSNEQITLCWLIVSDWNTHRSSFRLHQPVNEETTLTGFMVVIKWVQLCYSWAVRIKILCMFSVTTNTFCCTLQIQIRISSSFDPTALPFQSRATQYFIISFFHSRHPQQIVSNVAAIIENNRWWTFQRVTCRRYVSERFIRSAVPRPPPRLFSLLTAAAPCHSVTSPADLTPAHWPPCVWCLRYFVHAHRSLIYPDKKVTWSMTWWRPALSAINQVYLMGTYWCPVLSHWLQTVSLPFNGTFIAPLSRVTWCGTVSSTCTLVAEKLPI